MNVLAVVHGYPPFHLAGAEWTIHELMLGCRDAGHIVRVCSLASPGIAQDPSGTYEFERVRVVHGDADADYEWADVVVSHLDYSQHAGALARRFGKKFARLVHGPGQAGLVAADVTLANSEHILRVCQQYSHHCQLMRPHVPVHRYEATRAWQTDHGARLLVNTSAEKGWHTFLRLAQTDPDHEYLAVLGSYGTQAWSASLPANMTIHAPVPDMRKIYRQAGVILCPSEVESWGRVAVEAACSGIPAICSPVSGLMESMGPATTFAPLGNVQLWRDRLAEFDSYDLYIEACDDAWQHARWLERETERDRRRAVRRLEDLA